MPQFLSFWTWLLHQPVFRMVIMFLSISSGILLPLAILSARVGDYNSWQHEASVWPMQPCFMGMHMHCDLCTMTHAIPCDRVSLGHEVSTDNSSVLTIPWVIILRILYGDLPLGIVRHLRATLSGYSSFEMTFVCRQSMRPFRKLILPQILHPSLLLVIGWLSIWNEWESKSLMAQRTLHIS